MEIVVLGWLILAQTDSPFLVGAISAARMSLNIFALLAGVVADRVPRNRILASVEFLMAGLGTAMLVLIFSGALMTWHIFLITTAAGMVLMFQMPSEQSLVADTLPVDRIGNGAALNTLGRNLAMLIAPLVGGVLFKGFGPQGAFTAIASLYFLSGLFALNIRSTGRVTRSDQESIIRAVIGGLKYVKGRQVLWGTLVLALIIESSGWTFHTTLMPVFAKNVLGRYSTVRGKKLIPSLTDGETQAVTKTKVPPYWTVTAPSACLAIFPVSIINSSRPKGIRNVSGIDDRRKSLVTYED